MVCNTKNGCAPPADINVRSPKVTASIALRAKELSTSSNDGDPDGNVYAMRKPRGINDLDGASDEADHKALHILVEVDTYLSSPSLDDDAPQIRRRAKFGSNPRSRTRFSMAA